jgi:ankyrin repeat protein
MTTSKPLPARPSLESLRKQAKKLARDIAAGDADAIARARTQLPHVDLPLTQRNAQLVIAREYGYAGWQDLTAEVGKRLGKGLAWAVAQARRIIHDNDVERLKRLLAEYPALLALKREDGGGSLLDMAADSFGDSFDPMREEHFTRAACAELLIDAGAVVTPSIVTGILNARAKGLLQLFRRKGVLPRTLDVLAALGELDPVRTALDDTAHDLATVNDAFVRACSFEHEAIASLLLERSISRDPELGTRVDGSVGRTAFTTCFIEMPPAHDRARKARAFGLWRVFVMEQIKRAIEPHPGHKTNIHDAGAGDLDAFVRWLQREPWLLGDGFVWFQSELIGDATLTNREDFIVALLELDPAILRRQPPPPSQVFEFAFTYARTSLIPLLTRIWPLPDDLPHAAGMGNLARVKQWFDESGAPALGDLYMHYPCNDARARGHLDWDPPTAQHVLDVALAWSVVNRHFDVADFLLEHGADINTNWSSHESASILHELVFHGNYESMQFLIARGIDMTIQDYRWHATAAGWARYAANDEKMAQWLEQAERQRGQGTR